MPRRRGAAGCLQRPDGRQPPRFGGLGEQGEVDLVQQLVALLQVAAGAGGDDVRPRGLPAAAAGHHVVVGQLMRGMALVAVLAGVVVPLIQVLPRELDPARKVLHVAMQLHDRRQLQRGRRGMHGRVVGLQHVHLAQHQQHDGALPRDHLDRLVGRGQQ